MPPCNVPQWVSLQQVSVLVFAHFTVLGFLLASEGHFPEQEAETTESVDGLNVHSICFDALLGGRR